MYERILVPTDGSRGSERVADHAIAIAGAFDGTLEVVHVREDGTDEGRASMESIVERARDRGIDAEAAILEGRPHRAIVDRAEEGDADAIVMGTHGRDGLDRVLLGSVTERVVRLSPVPVLTVRLREGLAVTDEADAEAIAAAALEREGRTVTTFPEAPYRERGTWIVRARAEDGTIWNVHIDAATEEARTARIG